MSEIVFSKQFLRHIKVLPRTVQVKTEAMLEILAVDFRDSRLHSKKLKGVNEYYSLRVGRDYRVLFMFRDETVILILDIKHRKDIYKKL